MSCFTLDILENRMKDEIKSTFYVIYNLYLFCKIINFKILCESIFFEILTIIFFIIKTITPIDENDQAADNTQQITNDAQQTTTLAKALRRQ